MKKIKWNKGTIALGVMIGAYIVFGGAAITVYAVDGRAADKDANTAAEEANLQAEAPTEEDYVMSQEDYEEFMRLYGSATTETETETESEKVAEKKEDLSAYQQMLDETDKVLADAEKSSEEEKEEEKEAEAEKPVDTISGNMETIQNESDENVEVAVINGEATGLPEASSEKSEETAADQEDGRKYYTYKVTGIDTSLTLHRTKKEKNDSIDEMPNNYTGYVIEEPAKGDKRTLIIYKGKVGYGSNMYLKKTEISAADYPEDLKSITADDAGKDVLNGKTAGPAEGQ